MQHNRLYLFLLRHPYQSCQRLLIAILTTVMVNMCLDNYNTASGIRGNLTSLMTLMRVCLIPDPSQTPSLSARLNLCTLTRSGQWTMQRPGLHPRKLQAPIRILACSALKIQLASRPHIPKHPQEGMVFRRDMTRMRLLPPRAEFIRGRQRTVRSFRIVLIRG